MLREEPPLGAVLMAGWAVRQVVGWCVQVGEVDLRMLVSKTEIDFLAMCCETQRLRCWVSGLAVMTRRTKMIVPGDMAIYDVRPSTAEVFAPSNLFARMLSDNARTWAVWQTWQDILGPASGVRLRRVVHPLAVLIPPGQPLGARREIYIAYVFAGHMEAGCTSGSNRFSGSSLCPLGTSGFGYDQSKRLCLREGGEMLAHCAPRGCFLVANSCDSLLLAANGASNTHESSLPCLVVAAREALPAMARALGGLKVAVVSCVSTLLAASAPVVLASAELVAKHLSDLAETTWGRVIICDWTRAGALLVRAMRGEGGGSPRCTFLPCSIQITLTLEKDIQGNPSRARDIEELALFLGVPAELLGCPSRLRELLCERTLRMDDTPPRAAADTCAMRRYTCVEFSPPSDEELEDAPKPTSFAGYTRILLGRLADAGRTQMGSLPRGLTVGEYFAQRGRQSSSAFVAASFGKATTKDRACPLCLEDANARAVTCCGHWFCSRCISRALASGSRHCPVCREPLPALRDVVVEVSSRPPSSYLAQLVTLLAHPTARRKKVLLVTPFASCLERCARFLRDEGLAAWAWSGNVKQLQRNLAAFQDAEVAGGCLLCDLAFLSLRWLDLSTVQHVFVSLPLNPDCGEVCCQLRDLMLQTPTADLTFLLNYGAVLPADGPTCDGARWDCPFFMKQSG